MESLRADKIRCPLSDGFFLRRLHPLKPELSSVPAALPGIFVILPAGIRRQILHAATSDHCPQLPRLNHVASTARGERVTVS